ncbi:MAG: ABC transporter permease subunit [Gammaproteobacteria bacterium]|nr:ABC transporter permease subunit [Gammaproteobacteria bacterium]
MMLPVILWTDQLVFVLVAIVTLLAFYARNRPHLRAPWRAVLERPMGAVTLLVLGVYVAIALLDSLHFRLPVKPAPDAPNQETHYSVDVQSVLDLVLTPIRAHDEKTYSAPFATRLFVQESTVDADGNERRVYPRLQYGGAHLDDESARWSDIGRRTGEGMLYAGAIWVVAVLLLLLVLARRWARGPGEIFSDMSSGRLRHPWRSVLVTLFLLLAVIAMLAELAPYYHVFGTDKVGQDVLFQALKSIRTALLIGTLTTLIMLPFAILMGIMAGYLRGIVDDLIQYLYTTLNSIPGVLLIASAILLLQVYIDGHPEMFDTDAARADLRLLFLCMILGVTNWTGLCRLLRGETLKLSSLSYVEAAVAFGVRPARIMLRHLLPNVMHIVLISVVLDFSGLVLAEAVLSYVGVGVDPNMYSWGNMINSARLEMAREPMVWWSLAAAFVLMFALVLAANLFSDVVRDVFDPRRGKG